jgi:hypothetical protein
MGAEDRFASQRLSWRAVGTSTFAEARFVSRRLKACPPGANNCLPETGTKDTSHFATGVRPESVGQVISAFTTTRMPMVVTDGK